MELTGKKFSDFVHWVFYGMLCYLAATGINSLKSVESSISQLNTNVAILIERGQTQAKLIDKMDARLDNYDQRISNLEGKKHGTR